MALGEKIINLANRCNALLLRNKDRIFISVHHVFGHASNAGNECADIAAPFGTNGFMSECNTPAWWPIRHFRVQELFQEARCLSTLQGVHMKHARVIHVIHVNHVIHVIHVNQRCARGESRGARESVNHVIHVNHVVHVNTWFTWFQPTARCKPQNRLQCMSENCIYSWQYCFSKMHLQFFDSENFAKIPGKITIGPVVRNHISSKMAGRSIARQRTTYLSLSLV